MNRFAGRAVRVLGHLLAATCLGAACLGATSSAFAADPAPAPAAANADANEGAPAAQPVDPRQAALRSAFEAAGKVKKDGPQDVPLAGEAVLHLPANATFVPQPEAQRLLSAMGNPGKSDSLQGLIFPRGDDDRWFMTVRFEKSGYVKDDEAKDWDADGMLKSFREGTEEANKEREQMGVPGLDIVGWAEKPQYDAATHRLVWAMSVREKGAKPGEPQDVNYNTYALGRDGYFSMNLITRLDNLPALKSVAAQQLAALEYDAGKKYGDFNASTDHLAEYGIGALVVGLAAKKLGLIAIVGVFLVKFAKVIIIALAAFGGGFLKFFKRKPKASAAAPATSAGPDLRLGGPMAAPAPAGDVPPVPAPDALPPMAAPGLAPAAELAPAPGGTPPATAFEAPAPAADEPLVPFFYTPAPPAPVPAPAAGSLVDHDAPPLPAAGFHDTVIEDPSTRAGGHVALPLVPPADPA